MPRLTRDQVNHYYRTEWLCERDTAERVACPPRPTGCGAQIGETCTNVHTGQPLDRAPAHACRIRVAAELARRGVPAA